MDQRPKRRKSKDNPYILEYCEENYIYNIRFKDNEGILHSVNVNEDVFREFDMFELKDISQMNEYDRHIEHSEQYEETINKRMTKPQMPLDDFIISKISKEDIIKEIWKLPTPQNRRVYRKVVNVFSYTKIAKIENRAIPVIKRSIDRGILTLRKKIKFF